MPGKKLRGNTNFLFSVMQPWKNELKEPPTSQLRTILRNITASDSGLETVTAYYITRRKIMKFYRDGTSGSGKGRLHNCDAASAY